MSAQAVQVEIVASLGQFREQMKLAAESLSQMMTAMKAMGGTGAAGLDQATKATEGTSKATQGLIGDLKEFQKEQRQQSRMSGFLAKEITEMIPAAEGAKGALAGLIGVGVEAFAGGFGIGLALEAVKLFAFVINSIGEEERKANEAAVKFSEGLGKQTVEVWKNVEALQARREHLPDFEVEARQKLNERQEGLGGKSLLETQSSLRSRLGKLDSDFNANWQGRGAYDAEGHGYEQALIRHKREQLLLEQQLTQVTQAIIPIEAVRYEKALAWAKEFNAAQEKMVLDVEADARRIGAMGGSEREKIEADRTNKRIERERKYQEEKAKGVENSYAHSQALANIDNEADERQKALTRSVEAQNAVLRGQISALEALDEVERAVVTWQTERNRVQVALKSSAIEASTATLQMRLADEQYLVSLKKVNAENEKRALDMAQAQGLTDAITYDENGGMDLHKPRQKMLAEVDKNAVEAVGGLAQRNTIAFQNMGDAITGVAGAFAQLGGAVGSQVGAIVGGMMEILTTVIKTAVAFAAMSAAQAGGPLGWLTAIAAAVTVAATLIATIGGIQARELGGMFGPGTMLVGEKGPELLQVGNGVSGSVVPNHRLAMAGAFSGEPSNLGVTFNVNTFNSRGLEDYLNQEDNVVRRVLQRIARRTG